MIEVSVIEGDTAYAETPEAALVAARTLGEEARTGAWGYDPTIVFRVDDKIVQTTTLRALSRYELDALAASKETP